MKKIFIMALLVGFISSVNSQTISNSFELQKAKVSANTIIAGAVQNYGFGNTCVQRCQNSYNVCMSNATTPIQEMGCSVRSEVCFYNCGFDGLPPFAR